MTRSSSSLLSRRAHPEIHKPNQDSYTITPSFASRSTDIFFGVFDGHGRDGDKCAKFARDTLPPLLAESILHSRFGGGDELSKEAMQDAICKSHLECNRRMHASRTLDDSLSGTTAISMYLHGCRNRITVSNVGDSRAVVGRRGEKSDGLPSGGVGASTTTTTATSGGGATTSALKAFALSRDQTPYRRDERIRCRKKGARILSLDQIEGLEPVKEEEEEDELGNGSDMILGEEIDEGGDPPRVWSPNGDYPGTAFTRSIGDAIAEDLGVIAEPEMLTRELTPDDKIIVLASDGVFEFLTNQSVIDICAKFNDPLEACRAVVAESYELWLQYELRTDDITIICIFIDEVDSSSLVLSQRNSSADLKSSVLSSAESVESIYLENDELVVSDSRPVRKNISLEKSRALEKMKQKYICCKDVSDESDDYLDLDKLYNEKTDEEKARISEAISTSQIFQNISDAQRDLIYGYMEPMHVKKGQWIIRQGTVGDRFYIIDDGSFEVRIVPEGEEDVNNDGGDVVHIYTGARGRSHPSFGELALLHSAPRAASVIAQTDGQLWALHRIAFKKVVDGKGGKKDAEKVLRKMLAFMSFSPEELTDLSSYLCEAKYVSGDTIIKEGEPGDSAFIILPGGTCESVSAAGDGSTIKSSLGGDDFFGTEVLEKGGTKKYSCTVTAMSKVTCWILQKGDIKRVLGSVRKSEATA
eukprot:CCRYP_020665-RA/>CCRYP_020665-RA protein AED:0.04 eAED:0.04 QI:444/1/1/1/1/1/4/57/699